MAEKLLLPEAVVSPAHMWDGIAFYRREDNKSTRAAGIFVD